MELASSLRGRKRGIRGGGRASLIFYEDRIFICAMQTGRPGTGCCGSDRG